MRKNKTETLQQHKNKMPVYLASSLINLILTATAKCSFIYSRKNNQTTSVWQAQDQALGTPQARGGGGGEKKKKKI